MTKPEPIRTLQEQIDAAKSSSQSYCCLAYKPGQWTWKVVLETDSSFEAVSWFDSQTSAARVYRRSGHIYCAK